MSYKYPECVEKVEIYPPQAGSVAAACEKHNGYPNGGCKGSTSKPQPCKFNPSCAGRSCAGVRFWLEVTLDRFSEGAKDTMVVILKNPSQATATVCDITIRNVIEYIYSKKKSTGKIIILNLMPVYSTAAKTVKPHHICPLNIECIKCITKQHKDIIAAWGGNTTSLPNSDYNSLTGGVVGILTANGCTVSRVGDLNVTGHPKHGQRWSSADKIYKYP